MKVRLDLIFSDGMARRSGYSTVAKNDIVIPSSGLELD
jgi:hypothetical protein